MTFYDLDIFSKKNHRHVTSSSGRRRTTTNYDKYGYPVTSSGSVSCHTSGGVQVLRVHPGVIVNFVDGPSSSSSNRTWIPHSEYKPTRGAHDDGHREQSWSPTSPYHRSQDFYDEREQYHAPVGFDIPAPRSPPLPFHVSDAHHPDAYYATPGHPGSYHPDHPYEYPYYYPDSPILEPHYTEPVYIDESPHHSPQHVPSPIDKLAQPNSPDISNHSSHTSSSSYSEFRHDHDDRHYFDAQTSPCLFDVPVPVPSSPRARRRDPEPTSYGKPPSPLTPMNGRSVRFNDDPVEPPRRKGWWNRKGEQLWDNDGSYATARETDMYPLDLRGYPEPGVGWMNEEGVVIDMKRRLVRRRTKSHVLPLRSALKKTSL